MVVCRPHIGWTCKTLTFVCDKLVPGTRWNTGIPEQVTWLGTVGAGGLFDDQKSQTETRKITSELYDLLLNYIEMK